MKDGVHCHYLPFDTDDINLKSPSESNEHKFPRLLAAGNVQNSNGLTGVNVIGRVKVDTCYQGTMNSPLFKLSPSPCAGDDLNRVLDFVSRFCPTACGNATHLERIRDWATNFVKFLQSGSRWVNENEKDLRTIATGAGTVGKLIASVLGVPM